MRGHRGRRRLAVRAGDGDHAAHRRGGGEQLAAVGRAAARAAATSGRSAGIAVETTSSVSGSACDGVVADLRLDAGGAQLVEVRRLGRVAAGHLAPSACAISARPLMPAPPMPTKCSLRPLHGSIRRRARPSHPVADSTSRGDPRGGVGPRHGARAAAPSARSRAAVAEQLVHLRAQPRRVQLVVGEHDRRARVRHPARVLAPGGRRSRADTGSGSPACPPRRSRTPSRRRARPRGRWPRAGRPASRGTRTPGSRSRLAAPARATSAKSRAPGDVQHVHAGRPNASTAARLTDRAPRLPPNTSTHCASAATPSRAPRAVRGRPRRTARGTGPAGDEVRGRRRVPRSGTRGTRGARTARACGSRGRGGCRPRSAPAACGVRTAASPTGPATYPPPASTASAPMRAEQAAAPCRPPRRRARTAPSARTGLRRSSPLHRQELDRVAGGRHELRLGALAGADPDDVGAASPQLVCDRQRRHDVPGGPARCDHDGWHRPSL